MTARPLRLLLACVAAGAMLLTGCGGDTEDAAGDSPAATAPASTSASTSAPSGATAEPSTGTPGTYPVPAEYGVTELPLPPGAEGSDSNVVGESFGFYVFDMDPAVVLDFYEQALPTAGFTLSPNARAMDMVSGRSDTALVTVAVLTPDTVEVSVSAP
jgi:hypothetical protein